MSERRTKPLVPPEDAARAFLAAARAVERAWQMTSPLACGPETWGRLFGGEPLEPGPVTEFFGAAPVLVRALRSMARRADPLVLDKVDKPEPWPPDPWSPEDADAREALADRLLSAGVNLPAETLSGLTHDQMRAAWDWAGAAIDNVHAAKGDDVTVPPRPDFLPWPEWKGA